MKFLKQRKPQWRNQPPEKNSFRSIFKWGAPERFKHPSPGFLKVIKDELGIEDTQFFTPLNVGDEKVEAHSDNNLSSEVITLFEEIVGKDNISLTTYDRLKYSKGKSMEDILLLREGKIEQISDVVIHPRNKDDIIRIVQLCHSYKIPVHVRGGGSSVTLALDCPKGGVVLAMTTHMKRLIEFNETNQTITVESGMTGPEYESLLNEAPEKLNAIRAYTGGHFPQSFEFSTVGGWVAALGSGQASSFYGDAYDLVVALEIVTPKGVIKTKAFPATATGPKLNDIIKGSEGAFGVITSLTMKIFPHYPDAAKPFAFMFPDFKSGVEAARQISQAGYGMPAILRLSDPEETDVAMKMYGIHGGLIDRYIRRKGCTPGKRCLLMGQTMGYPALSKTIFRQLKKTAGSSLGVYLTGYPMKKWYQGRFSDPYLRDSLNDFGVLIDTLEASVTWEDLPEFYRAVRSYIKARPNMILMTHASHFYAQGTNLYFIFITRMSDIESFRSFQRGIIQKIIEHKGSPSHHHGVGRMMGPFMKTHLGEEQMEALTALKNHFDPHHIFTPGVLGL